MDEQIQNEIDNSLNAENSEVITEETSDDSVETTLTVDDYNALLAEKEKLERTNKQLYARLKNTKTLEPLKNQVAPSNDRLEEIELKLELKEKGIPAEAIPFIKKNGGLKALEDPFVMAAVETIKTQAAAERAISGESASKSDIEKKFTLDQMRSMPISELEAMLRQQAK